MMPNTVAVGTDGSPTAAKALDAAIDLAVQSGARLVVISSYRPVAEDRVRKLQDEAPADVQWAITPTSDVQQILDEAASNARARGVKVTTVASEGDPADVLCHHAAAADADVLVIGNKGMNRRVLGSVPNTVAHRAPCSVMIVKTT